MFKCAHYKTTNTVAVSKANLDAMVSTLCVLVYLARDCQQDSRRRDDLNHEKGKRSSYLFLLSLSNKVGLQFWNFFVSKEKSDCGSCCFSHAFGTVPFAFGSRSVPSKLFENLLGNNGNIISVWCMFRKQEVGSSIYYSLYTQKTCFISEHTQQ